MLNIGEVNKNLERELKISQEKLEKSEENSESLADLLNKFRKEVAHLKLKSDE